ncbi:aminodeoxychorismate synthase component I [Balneolales bacterium ANBcel1]|nr:aminodeoxychorismate synthase component I [Balneolales bacterium ANBcel1]
MKSKKPKSWSMCVDVNQDGGAGTGREAAEMNRRFPDKTAMNQWIRAYLQRKRRKGPVVFLDSQLEGHAASEIGYIASDPQSVIRGRTDESTSRNLWDELEAYRQDQRDWLFGWLGYDLKNDLEELRSSNPDPIGLPDLFFFVPAVVIAVNRAQLTVTVLKGGRSELFCVDDPAVRQDENSRQNATGYQNSAVFQDPAGRRDPVPQHESRFHEASPTGNTGGPFVTGPLKSGDGWEAYRDKVSRVIAYIARGDTYEVNLTHQLQSDFHGDSLDLFDAMRESGPVPFGAWIHCDEDTEICCASPERFLQLKDGVIRSQPIKGTSPRGETRSDDERIVSEILHREKNRAENVMIVDLVRHDLGRIAKTGTVRTDALLEVQTFATVHQLVSTISAVPKKGLSPVDMIRACFPMGSMTGAPKIRTMQIIEELESYRRGLYSGAIGYITPKGEFDFNVVIRTAIIKNGRLFYSVGGAITADSDPAEEWEESWLKSRALTDAGKNTR